jgi:hypothetical protein
MTWRRQRMGRNRRSNPMEQQHLARKLPPVTTKPRPNSAAFVMRVSPLTILTNSQFYRLNWKGEAWVLIVIYLNVGF